MAIDIAFTLFLAGAAGEAIIAGVIVKQFTKKGLGEAAKEALKTGGIKALTEAAKKVGISRGRIYAAKIAGLVGENLTFAGIDTFKLIPKGQFTWKNAGDTFESAALMMGLGKVGSGIFGKTLGKLTAKLPTAIRLPIDLTAQPTFMAPIISGGTYLWKKFVHGQEMAKEEVGELLRNHILFSVVGSTMGVAKTLNHTAELKPPKLLDERGPKGSLRFKGRGSGTMGGNWYVDEEGVKWFLKPDSHHSELQTSAEVISSRIYEHFGYTTPETVIVNIKGKRYSASKFLGKRRFADLSKNRSDKFRQMRIIAAYLKDWDRLANIRNNFNLGNDEFASLDFGGTLGSRAHGMHKAGKVFSEAIGTFETTEDISVVYDSFKVNDLPNDHPWRNLVQNDAHQVIDKFRTLTDEKIEEIVKAAQYSDQKDAAYMIEALKKRRDGIITNLLSKFPVAKPMVPKANEKSIFTLMKSDPTIKGIDHSTLKEIMEIAYPLYAKGLGIHGAEHIDRVVYYALKIATLEKYSPKEMLKVALAAFFHDVGRISGKGHGDREHSKRSVEKLKVLLKDDGFSGLIAKWDLSKMDWKEILFAIENHSNGKTSKNKIAAALWDADRLDLFRLRREPGYEGYIVKAEFLSTETARAMLKSGEAEELSVKKAAIVPPKLVDDIKRKLDSESRPLKIENSSKLLYKGKEWLLEKNLGDEIYCYRLSNQEEYYSLAKENTLFVKKREGVFSVLSGEEAREIVRAAYEYRTGRPAPKTPEEIMTQFELLLGKGQFQHSVFRDGDGCLLEILADYADGWKKAKISGFKDLPADETSPPGTLPKLGEFPNIYKKFVKYTPTEALLKLGEASNLQGVPQTYDGFFSKRRGDKPADNPSLPPPVETERVTGLLREKAKKETGELRENIKKEVVEMGVNLFRDCLRIFSTLEKDVLTGFGFKDVDDLAGRIFQSTARLFDDRFRNSGWLPSSTPKWITVEALRKIKDHLDVFVPKEALTHGTTSAALPGLVDKRALLSMTELMKRPEKSMMFTGEKWGVLSQESNKKRIESQDVIFMSWQEGSHEMQPNIVMLDEANIDLIYALSHGRYFRSKNGKLSEKEIFDLSSMTALEAEYLELIPAEGQHLVLDPFPVIIQARDFDRNLMHNIRDVMDHDFKSERVYDGSLKLEEQISEIFVPRDKVDLTKNYLNTHEIHGVNVFAIEDLMIARMLFAQNFKLLPWDHEIKPDYREDILNGKFDGIYAKRADDGPFVTPTNDTPLFTQIWSDMLDGIHDFLKLKPVKKYVIKIKLFHLQ
ncbi:protein containing Metal-dependent phosphohydrolase domain [sediment metagenome]|uniref:Protein containing Metal-dependent phosphohydrolase domain n=1 Tax=sediment metagenome TaxID=749907 RepID=D9PJW4_9ZZZZ